MCAGVSLLVLAVVPAVAWTQEIPESPWKLAGLQERARGFADVVPACLTEAEGEGVGKALRIAAEGRTEQAVRLLPDTDTPPVTLLRAILEARSRPVGEAESMRGELQQSLRQHERPRARVCAHLERARLALLVGHEEEAFGDLALAQRTLSEVAAPEKDELAQQADYYRAEALWMSGRDQEALFAYGALRDGGSAKVAWVAKIRAQTADPDLLWKQLRPTLDRGRALGVDLDGWSVLAGDLALHAGNIDDALFWLTRAEEALPHESLTTIRKADVLIVERRLDLARRILTRVERRGDSRVAREIASIRLASPNLGDESRREARLIEAARSTTPNVQALALEGLTYFYLSTARPEEALETVGRWRSLARRDEDGLDVATNAAVQLAVSGSEDCITVVRRLAGGRDIWLKSVRTAEPMLRLGACASELGLTSTAADVYRAIGRRFPDFFGPELALRIARASWELGEEKVVESIVAAHDRAVANTEVSFEAEAPWMLLRSEMAIAEGRTEAAFDDLRKIVEIPETPPRIRALAMSALVELPVKDAMSEELAKALEAGLRWPSDQPPAMRARAWLRLGDTQRKLARRAAARQAYAKAAELLPTGAARGRVLHAMATSSNTQAERQELFNELAASTPSRGWAALARGELRLGPLRRLLVHTEDGKQ